jgi:hypothetical protein
VQSGSVIANASAKASLRSETGVAAIIGSLDHRGAQVLGAPLAVQEADLA